MEEKPVGWEPSSLIRINVFVEGQTEETFIRDLLIPYFSHNQIFLTPIIAETSPGHKGGIVSYGKIQRQIRRLCQSDPSAYVTTMIDYYGLPKDFPDLKKTGNENLYDKVNSLEKAFEQDISAPNFLAHLQVHEFEALLFCQPKEFSEWFDDDAIGKKLLEEKGDFDSPEHINNDKNTAPSKRIIAAIPNYRKVLHGPLIAESIGIDEMRKQCLHFNDWIERLMRLKK